MNRISSLAAAAALALGSLGAAWAQTGADDPQHSDARNSRQNGNFYIPGMRNADREAARTARQNGYSGGQPPEESAWHGGYSRGHDDDGHRRYDGRNGGRSDYAQRDWRAYGYEHRWQRGDRLPPEYRSHTYVVDDWRGHHLSAPPRGYHWVQQGNDYLLVAIATGVIASVLLNQ